MPDQITAILHNTKTGEYHPLLFRLRPSPSHDWGDNPNRYKSFAHSKGYPTSAQAINALDDLRVKDVPRYLAAVFPWDGEGIPGVVVFFSQREDGVIERAF